MYQKLVFKTDQFAKVQIFKSLRHPPGPGAPRPQEISRAKIKPAGQQVALEDCLNSYIICFSA
jgi:hypothetical protein